MVERDQPVEFSWVSERHLRLSFGTSSSGRSDARVYGALAAIQNARLPEIREITPAYSTILLEFALEGLDEQRAVNSVRTTLSEHVEIPAGDKSSVIEIPVCYETACAPDALTIAQNHDITVEELVRLHSQPTYFVQFIGFSPGFAYLTGLPPQIATPRLATPRVRVPAGSVGIAGDQTGIYPTATAGGWQLIGRTPLIMFDARRNKPSLLVGGDRVRFIPISLVEFNDRLRGRNDNE